MERAAGENGSLQHVEVRRIDARDIHFAERESLIRARDEGGLSGDGRGIVQLDVVVGVARARQPVHEGDAGDPWLSCNAPAQLVDG